MFRTALIALLGSTAAVSAKIFNPSEGVAADSAMGQALLRKAQVVEPSRHLEQQDRDVTFIAKYDIKYLGCSSLIQVNPEGNADEGILYTQHLVRFALCPQNSCSSCSGGGEYVVNMLEFVDAYTEAKLNEKEYQCEMIRENCYCDNANDDEVCENQCYSSAGMDSCIEYEGQEEFEIQRYLECAEMEDGGNNNNNNANYYNNGNNNNNNGENYYGELFIGPYCASDGHSIHLGVFYDQGCTSKASSSLYSKRNYGASLPFSNEPIVQRECISCQQVDNDNNNNNNNNQNQNQNNDNNNNYYYQQDYEVTELCEQSYEQAVRCESGMNINYKDTNGCDYINNILPRLSSASRASGVYGGMSTGNGAATAFAWVFAATTILFGAYAYFLYRKIKRGGAGSAATPLNQGNLA